jgi:hypothetical protein
VTRKSLLPRPSCPPTHKPLLVPGNIDLTGAEIELVHDLPANSVSREALQSIVKLLRLHHHRLPSPWGTVTVNADRPQRPAGAHPSANTMPWKELAGAIHPPSDQKNQSLLLASSAPATHVR